MHQTNDSANVVILSKEYDAYHRALSQYNAPAVHIVTATDDPQQIDLESTQVMLADPGLAASVIEKCKNIKWVQSGWAGNTPLLEKSKRDYWLSGVKGVFDMQMREYVFSYLLYFSRNIAGFDTAKKHSKNKWCKPEFNYLKGKTLGILGAGSIGSALVPIANAFGMHVIGLRKSGAPQPGFKKVYQNKELLTFARQSDFVVSLLPDTPHTRGIIDAQVLAALPPSAVLINAGRGNAIVEDDLLHALDTHQIAAAVLDVFEQEPLPDAHPFWQHDKIHITQHTAATSLPEDVVAVFYENYQRYISGLAPNYLIDFDKGY